MIPADVLALSTDDLRAQYLRQREILEHLPIGISLFDSRQLLAYANQRYYDMLTLSPVVISRGTHARDILQMLIDRGDIRREEATGFVDRQLDLLRSGTPHAFQRLLPSGNMIEVSGVPFQGGCLRTYTESPNRNITRA